MQGQAEYVQVNAGGELADYGYKRHTHEGRALAENVHQAVKFAAALRGDDLAQVAAAEGLNAALKHSNHDGEKPELPLADHEYSEQHHTGVGDDANLDEQAGVIFCRQPPEQDGAGEGHDLGQKQCQKQSGGVQPQRGAVGGSHVDDGVHAVDEEEKGQQIHENVLFLFRVPDGAAQLPEGVKQRAFLRGDEGGLPVAPQQRDGASHPPQGGNQKRDDHGAALGQAEGTGHQHQNQAEDEGNYRADVTKGKAHGGHLVHALLGSDLRQHGVVEDNAGGVADPGQNKQAQEGQPARRGAQHCAACHAHQHGDDKKGLFQLPVRQRAADGAENGHQNGGDGAGVAPVAHV